jgi:hypothetical protein
MNIIDYIVKHPGTRYKLPDDIEEKLNSFPNESLARNTDVKNFPKIQNTRAKIASRLRNRKIIPRVPFYTDKRKKKLQISGTIEEFNKNLVDMKEGEEQIINQNMEEQSVMQEYDGLREIEYFNQWFAANNFDILRFNETYEKITIDENEPEIDIEKLNIDLCDV